MPDTGEVNVEIAHYLSHGNPHGQGQSSRAHEILEIIEAIVLALVAVSTAWGGYQAALWGSQESQLYEQSTKLRVEAQGLEVSSNLEREYDASTVVEWLKAEFHGENDLARLFERRVRPEFNAAFEAWKKTDPLHNPSAPAGPTLMKEYTNSKVQEAARLNREASEIFERGRIASQRGDQYVRMTVTLATVLLLTAISQRFRTHKIRVVLMVLAFLLLCFPLWRIITLPRA